MTKEKDIIDNLRYNIIRRYWVDRYFWKAEDLAVYVATFVFPFTSNILLIKEEIERERNEQIRSRLQTVGTIGEFISLIVKISKQENKIDLPKLRKDALMSYFYQKFADSPIDVAKLFAQSLSFLQINDDGNVLITKDETFMTNICNRKPSTIIEPSYGEESLDLEQVSEPSYGEESLDLEQVSDLDLEKKTEQKPKRERSTNTELDDEKAKAAIKKCWSSINLDSNLLKSPYFWENKFSKNQYTALKKMLAEFFKDKKKDQQKKDLNIDKCSLLVALYVAEWFKWEYSGNEGGGDSSNVLPKVFKAINLQANVADDICTRLNLAKHNLLYQTDNNTNRWLNSLYALGGFPLSKSEDYKKVFKTIYELRKDDEEKTSNEGLKEIADAISNNNQAFLQSAEKKDGSFHKYIEYIWKNNDIPVSDADKASEEYKSIKKLLDEGRIEVEKNKFKLEWEALLYNGHWKLSLLLTFIKDITIQRDIAEKWGASDGKLNLVVKNGNEDLRRLTFYRTKEGDYACYKNYKKYVLASDEGEWNFGVLHGQKRIDFEKPVTICCNNEKTKTHSFTLDKEWKFRDAGMFRWTTAGKKGNLAVFLPFKNKVDINGNLESPLEEFRISDSTSLWIPICNKLEGCQYNKKSIGTLYPYESGKIYIEPKSLIHSDVIHYHDGKFVNFLNEDEMQNVLLIHGVNDLKCILYDDKNKEEEYKEITPDKIDLAFDNEGDEEKQTGYCRVTATYNNKTTTVDCYIVGKNFNPQRKKFCKDVDFTKAYVNIEDPTYGGLHYDVYVGEAGIYNAYTKRMLNNKGVFRHLDCYYYRNKKGTLSPLYQENKYKALKKIFNDINADVHNSGNSDIVLTIKIDGNGFTFQPFSNKAICVTDDYKYRVPLNRQDNGLEGCTFCYCTFDDILKVNEVSTHIETGQNPGYVYLDFTRSETCDGFLFQSLKAGDNSTSEYYFRPMFIPKKGGEREIRDREKTSNRKKNIQGECQKLKESNYKGAVNAFLLATEHKLYYTSMDSLCALVHEPNPKLLIEFYLAYNEYCLTANQKPNYEALYALADELLFDWWLIPQYEWSTFKNDHQEAIEGLLREKPVSTDEEEKAKQRIVDSFWCEFGTSNSIGYLEKEKKKIGNDTLTVAKSLRSTTPKQGDNFFNKKNWDGRTIFNFSFVILEKILTKKQ